MEKAKESIESEQRRRDLPTNTENIAFKPEEMIECRKCARMNPPVRLKCFYCASELEISAEQAANLQTGLRKLEDWEKGYNLIYQPNSPGETKFDTAEIAKILRLEAEVLRKIVETKKTLPLVRVESKKEAEIIAGKLREKDLLTFIVSDEKLSPDILPTRLRSLEFDGDRLALVLFNTSEIREIRRDDLILIVSGTVFERKTEAVEKRKKGESVILDASETASDENLIDIYSRDLDANGYRITAKGFDFSSLEAEKGIVARENMQKLIEKLREFAPDAKFDGDYSAIREVLGNVWEIENRKDSQGLKRHGFGKFDFSNIATSSNLRQFTKYSRLQREIL
ncbi:MAG TPA: hypothetical protein VF692_13805 [Pyrinomonadaceae bacterium]|jgi:hypothetical protein